MSIHWTPTKKDFEVVASWSLDRNPFSAIDDYSDLKRELRWLNPGHRKCHDNYFLKRLEYMEFIKNYDHYYKTANKPVDRIHWEYLMARKAWYIMPLGWDNFAEGGKIIDIGCGDGDTIQRVIRHVENIWMKRNISDRKLHIVGFDLNSSRIDNASRLVNTVNSNISFEFIKGSVIEGIDFPDKHFDYAISTGVIEIIDQGPPLEKFLGEWCRITRRGIYSEELMDEYPGGVPRRDLAQRLAERGFRTKELYYLFTEPFDLFKMSDPIKLWPILWEQNLYAERF